MLSLIVLGIALTTNFSLLAGAFIEVLQENADPDYATADGDEFASCADADQIVFNAFRRVLFFQLKISRTVSRQSRAAESVEGA